MTQQGFSIRLNGIIGFLFLILMMVALFFIAKGIFTVLAWMAPVLLVGALLINYRTILNYLKFMLGLLQRNPLSGIIGIVLSVIGFPVLCGVLFGKSIFDRKVRKLQQAYEQHEQGEYVEYEDVTHTEPDTRFDLPPLKKESSPEPEPAPKKENKEPESNRYEDLF